MTFTAGGSQGPPAFWAAALDCGDMSPLWSVRSVSRALKFVEPGVPGRSIFFSGPSEPWDEYNATSREISTAIYNVPVIASIIASVRAPHGESGVMSP